MSTDTHTGKLGTALGLCAPLLAAGATMLWFRQVRLVAIPENRSLFVAAWILAIALGLAAFVQRTRWFGGIAAVLGIGIGALLLFTVAISRQEVAPNSIRVGETMPQFTALDERGERFDSASLAGELVLLKFFRGHW